jgi:hypothetical protein
MLLALAGCAAGASGRAEFSLAADQLNGAWGAVMARAYRDAANQGVDPLWDPVPPRFSAATCRWIEPGRKAHCRYRVARGLQRPGSARHWVDEQADLYVTETGWDFGY